MKKSIFTLVVAFATLNCFLGPMSLSAQCTKLLDFTGAANGNAPYGDLFSDGTFLYGMTSAGGAHARGVIFKIKPDGTGYTDLLDFVDTANGKSPYGSLISDGTFLYGTTNAGGTHGFGTLFKIKPDGTGFSKLLDFTYAANGANPWGSLFYDGTYLYGMTSNGGANSFGTIFKIKPDGTGYTTVLAFSGVADGGNPQGSFIFDGTYLYGMTTGGGANGGSTGYGVIFKIRPDGTGYTKLLDFAGMTNGNTPQGSLVSDGTFLYGMTTFGGANSAGTIFKIKPDGTGYADLFDFVGGFSTGTNPWGSLISDGTYLYGMTRNFGASGDGTIFRIKNEGTGYSDLYAFDMTNGGFPQGSLISVGTDFYGMTYNGGTSSDGTVFKFHNTSSTGISHTGNTLGQLSVYPNPTNGKITIANSGMPVAISKLEIYNAMGEAIYTGTDLNIVNSKEIDLSDFPKGTYFLKLDNGTSVHTKTIVLQ